MLRSIKIECWDCSLKKPDGNSTAKKLTLRDSGHVIFVEKDFGDEENTSIITYKTFDKEVVRGLLDKAERLFTPDLFSTDIKTWYCDACPDTITLKKENGEVICGQLKDLTDNLEKVADYYLEIEELLDFNVDLTFLNADD